MTVKKNRKKPFSISLYEPEIEEVDSFVEELGKALGFDVSRNELTRKALLAHVRFKTGKFESYEAAEKSIKG